MNSESDSILHKDDIDQLAQALVSMARELWVAKDRQKILEAALVDAGVIQSDTIDGYQPKEKLRKELEIERKQLIDGLIRNLTETAR